MEESFELRVKRLFGSQLFDSVPRSSFPASSWSVVDGEVERREWNRERGFGPDRSEDPCSSDFAEDGCFARKRRPRKGSAEDFESDMDEVDDDRDEEGRREEEGEDRGVGDYGEATEIRSSIGLDPTLDNEDEEDDYDRAAVGGDASDERLYMSDIKNNGPHLNYHSIFSVVEDDPYDGSHHFRRDPRADRLAANERIQEDEKASENFHVLSYSRAEVAAEDVKLRPILKRKELQDDSKPKKRVRFDHVPEPDNDPSFAAVDSTSADVPDYLKNPSKYRHYSFDVYEDGDFANKGAFEDFQNLLHRKPDPEELRQETADELLKSITFNHRRKSVDAMVSCNDGPRDGSGSDSGGVRSTSIAACESFEESFEVGDSEIGEDGIENAPMDMEGPEENEKAAVSSRRGGRRYRSVAAADV